MKKSVWSEIEIKKFPHLEGDKKCDVLIIGGGLCGILCAYRLKNMCVDYVLVEGGRIGRGTTENTTGKITSQHSLIYYDIAQNYSKEKAQMYLNANENALAEYLNLAKNIDCDFEIKDAYTYSLDDREIIEREVRTVESLGMQCSFADETELPFKIAGAVKFSDQAQFNPMKFIKGICTDLNIYENTFVEKIEGNTAITKRGSIKAKKIIIATHYPFINSHGSYFLKLYQNRSYALACTNVPAINGMYVDCDNKGMSFRSYKDFLIVVGGGHRTGKSTDCHKGIKRFIEENYPLGQIKYEWAAQDTMSLDKIPYIGVYSKNTPDLYVASGFNKWGITNSMTASKILTDMVLGNENEYSELFLPMRRMAKTQLLLNGIETTVNFVNPASKRCTHLGCALKWNKYEHSWDCACHGSRFDEEGNVINNPAKKKLL